MLMNRMKKTVASQTEKIDNVGDVIRKFGLLTSVRGVPRIVKAQSEFWRTVWTVFVLLFFVTSSYQVITLVRNYYEYPKKQWQEIQTENDNFFPGVTLCNLHSLGSKWEKLPEDSPTTFTANDYFNKIRNFIPHMNRQVDIWHHLISTTGYYQNIPYELAKRYGPNYDELVVLCQVRISNGSKILTLPCRKTLVDSAQYFNCYTVGAREEEQKQIMSLNVILYLDDFFQATAPGHLLEDYPSQMHGARVVIHRHGSYPDIDSDGMDVYPGTSVHFRFETRRWEHLNFPVGSCDDVDHDYTIEDEHGESYTYTYWHCLQLCKQTYIIKQCGCRSAEIPISSADKLDDLQYCAALNDNITLVVERLNCLSEVGLNQPAWQTKECQCPHPCIFYRYPSTMTMSKWPHNSYQLAFYDRHIKNKSHYPKQFQNYYEKILETMKTNMTEANERLMNFNLINRHFVRIEVTNPNSHTTIINEKLEITPTQLVSSIGGAFSFWLGITVVTLVEILELIFDFIKLAVRKVRKRFRPDSRLELEGRTSKRSMNNYDDYFTSPQDDMVRST